MASCAEEADLDHALAAADTGGDSLYAYIDLPKVRPGRQLELRAAKCSPQVRALNEEEPGSQRNPFKPWDKRTDIEPYVLSADDDPELILHVPFTCGVQLRSICIAGGGEDGSAPAAVRIFADREDIDFAVGHSLRPAQEINPLALDRDAELDNPLLPSKFRCVTSVTLFFTDSHDGGSTRVNYIGFKGKMMRLKQQPVQAVYELIGAPEATDPLASALGTKYVS
jgi:hypothetical protein